MLRVCELNRILDEVTYWNGYTFHVIEGHPEGLQLRIHIRTEDAYRRGQGIDLRVDTFIPPCDKPSDFLKWLAYRLGRVALHESAEALRFRGNLVRDPHGTWGM